MLIFLRQNIDYKNMLLIQLRMKQLVMIHNNGSSQN